MLENGRKKTFKLGYGALTTVVLQYSYVYIYIYIYLSLSQRGSPFDHWILNGYMRMNMSLCFKKNYGFGGPCWGDPLSKYHGTIQALEKSHRLMSMEMLGINHYTYIFCVMLYFM